MILARRVTAEDVTALSLALDRLAIDSTDPVRDGELTSWIVLVTGLEAEQVPDAVALVRSSRVLSLLAESYERGALVLQGRRGGFRKLTQELDELAGEDQSGVEGALAQAFARLDRLTQRPPALQLGPRRFEFGARTFIMGVLNVTPDSFSDGGKFHGRDAAVAHARAMVDEGADLLDVGGESTRPGAAPVTADEELSRVLPVIEALRAAVPETPLSIDTMKPEVARRAVEAGAHLVNDVTGFRDPEMARAVAETGAAACLMHMQGEPRTMQAAPTYDDLIEELLVELEAGLLRGQVAGVPRERMIVDPGFGFGKTPGHNLHLVRRLGDLRLLGCPVLLGTSRKSTLSKVLGGRQAEERIVASAASVAVAVASGAADFVRVHDVRETRDAVLVAEAIRQAREAGLLFGAGPS